MRPPHVPDLTSTSVRDVVVRMPKTLGRDATVGEASRALESSHVHMLLLTEAGRLLGTLVRDDLPEDLDPGSAALDRSVLEGRTIAPSVPAEVARRRLVEQEGRRLAVVDEHGQLVGLLCLKRQRHGFCSDADVRARAADRRDPEPGS